MAADRITSGDMWRYANDYRVAAIVVAESQIPTLGNPIVALLGQSIELALKAFLLEKKVPLTDLRNSFGHDLAKLAGKAKELEVNSLVELSEPHWSVIELISEDYKDRRFHYFKSGRKFSPELKLAIEIAEKLCEKLKPLCNVLTPNF